MADRILEAFLGRQFEEGMALAEASDLLELVPQAGDSPPRRYLARFRCRGLVRTPLGEITTAEDFGVGISFGQDYLRRAEVVETLTWLWPRTIWHPNISDRIPVLCVGRLAPGTSLADLLFQLFEIVTFAKVTMREDDALNKAACAWARENRHRLPIDPRPLKRRSLALTVELRTDGESDVSA